MKKAILFIHFLCFSFFIISQDINSQFNANQETVCIGEAVSFLNLSTSSSSITSWAWDFGDGTSSNLTNPTHTYTNSGIYTVILIVTDQNSNIDSEVKLNYITINPKPTAQFELLLNDCTLPIIPFITNQSDIGNNITYSWNFGNGQTSNLINPTNISYTSENIYTVSLLVTNTITNCFSDTIQSINISEFNSDFIIQDSVCVGDLIQAQDISSLGVNSWIWSDIDGQYTGSFSTSFYYNSPGIHTLTLISQNTISGCIDSISHDFFVVPNPTINIMANPSSGCIPLNVGFTNSSINASNFIWDFGDGSPIYTGSNSPNHIYNSYGNFNVSLIATGNYGCTSDTLLLNYIQTSPPIANFNSSSPEGCTPLSVHFDNISTSSNNINDPIVSWLWNFGNGITSILENPPNVNYTTGIYTVSLQITTLNGCVDIETKIDTIKVGEIDTVLFSFTPPSQCSKANVTFTNLSVINVPYNPSEIGYSWDFGDGGASNQENPIWNYPTDTGYFDVQLTLTFRGCQKNVKIDSAIYIKAPISLFSPAQTLYCNPSVFPVHVIVNDLATIGKIDDDVKMIWKWGDALNSSTIYEDTDLDPDDNGSSSFNYSSYGTFPIKQIVYNYTTGCSDSTIIPIIISQTTANFILSNDSICKNDEVVLTSTSTSTDPFGTFSYNMGNGSTATGDPLTYTYSLPGLFNITLTATNSVGCSSNKTFIGLRVLPPPAAGIAPWTVIRCLPSNYSFPNASTIFPNGYPSFSSFFWTFPDGTTQTTYDLATFPTYYFDSIGTFTTTIVATDGFGCVSTPSFSLVHISKPIPDFNLTDSIVCNLEDFTLTNNSTGLAPLSCNWKIDNSTVSSNSNLNYSFTESTNSSTTSVAHTVQLIVTDLGGCIDSISKTIYVSIPHANLDYITTGFNVNANNEASCPPILETFENQSSALGNFNSLWTFGDNKTSSILNPSNIYVFAGNYTLNLEITDENGCTDDTTLINHLIIGGPSTDYSVTSNGNICDDIYTFDTLNSTGIDHLSWDFGDGTISSTSAVVHTYTEEGIFNPSLIIYDEDDCQVPISLPSITVVNELNAFFVPSTLSGKIGDEITFDDQSIFNTSGISWNWEFGDLENSSILNNTDINSSIIYEYPYLYPVTLTVTDLNGCTDDYQVKIYIEGSFEVPNVFTSNNDGENDLFVFPKAIFKSYDVIITNRWGGIVAENLNQTGTLIWDGSNKGNEQCVEGVYFYTIKGILKNETPFELTGFVTKF